MFQRLALKALRQWAEKEGRKPLVLRGARQVGKTTLVKIFAEEFDVFIYLNLEEKVNADLFTMDVSFEDLLAGIYVKAGIKMENQRTLIFIDEIQNVPDAVKVLRYFYEKRPDLYVIAAGSLLESLVGNHISFPVGRVEYMALHPCTFTEFLGALGENILVEQIEQLEVPQSVHSYVMDLFKKYMIVGGLPEAVANYAKRKDWVSLNEIFNSLLSGYKDDIEKYAQRPKEQDILRYILNYGWGLAGQRFQFSKFCSSSYKSAEMGNAFRTLEKTLLLELVYPLISTSFPILPDLKRSPKLLWLDTGLVNYVAGMQESLLFTSDTDELWNGHIAEQVVGQELLGASFAFGVKRMFWVRDARNSQAEVDFVYKYKSHLIPVEVKTGDNSKLRSLHQYMDESQEDIALRLWNGPLTSDLIRLPSGKQYTLYNMPFYYAGQLETFFNNKFA
ncbi:ATP-binding protein [Bacteroides cellulosilyticus]|uniref:ATP-binding protein n=1 Tax=Bacteroides cellulosilyticus TaxID=246787 RepID=UPI001C37B0E1|nr:AAA family ATPase [Bacteroides cellulosilyticus]MBV3635920.1 AAA family ATPase [Bacteroides cellulosilyticus]MBV3662241.1 AAA family ATPase [Bacteroides cellulosilyticus]MBV3684362.1 AAA family ATPase [Bacteroides cellulosilyticus]MBV3692923.1 AAA family ATPase [Bacteroides cellulosilyticus]MBV3706410.1 AAA family ATPase [Bacteroides cellulosilyticus]